MKVECQRCGQPFTVPDSWLHEPCECPRCGERNVPSARAPSTEKPRDDEDDELYRLADEETPAARPTASGTSAHVAEPALDPSDSFDDEYRLADEEARPPALGLDSVDADDLPVLPSTRSRPRSPTPQESKRDLAASQKSPRRGKRASRDCPKCGAGLPPDGMLCLECGYHVVLRRVLQGDLNDVDIDLSIGFTRWFNSLLTEGESATTLLWVLHALVAVVLSVFGLVFAPWGWYVAGVMAIGYVALCLWLTYGSGSRRAGEILWNRMLAMRRRMKWRDPVPPFTARRAFTSHEPDFDDDRLAELPNLETVEALDLEGTGITDRALRSLQYAESLRWIVVRGTRMTLPGVTRLQIMKPELSIWYDEPGS